MHTSTEKIIPDTIHQIIYKPPGFKTIVDGIVTETHYFDVTSDTVNILWQKINIFYKRVKKRDRIIENLEQALAECENKPVYDCWQEQDTIRQFYESAKIDSIRIANLNEAIEQKDITIKNQKETIGIQQEQIKICCNRSEDCKEEVKNATDPLNVKIKNLEDDIDQFKEQLSSCQQDSSTIYIQFIEERKKRERFEKVVDCFKKIDDPNFYDFNCLKGVEMNK